MQKNIIILILFIISFSCTTEEQPVNRPTIEIEKVNSIKLEQSASLFGKFHEQVKVSENGDYLILAERIKDQIFVFNSDGSLYNVIGEYGRGPKGILKVYGYDINSEEEILILDSSQWMLKTFDIDGNLVFSTTFFDNVPIQPSPFGILWYKENFIVSILEKDVLQAPDESSLIATVGKNGKPSKLIGKHDPFTLEDNQMSLFSEIVVDETNDLVYTNLQSSPYYQVHDLKAGERVGYGGKLNENFKVVKENVPMYSSMNNKMTKLVNTSGTRRLYLTDEFVIQHRQLLTEEWFETAQYEDKKNSLVFNDKETNKFIQEIFVPHTPVGVHGNLIYFIEDFNPDNYTIGIYEIIAQE